LGRLLDIIMRTAADAGQAKAKMGLKDCVISIMVL